MTVFRFPPFFILHMTGIFTFIQEGEKKMQNAKETDIKQNVTELTNYIRELQAEGRLYKFYKNRAFQKLRAEVIHEAHGECQECLKKSPKRLAKGTVVHHIKHVDEYPELALTKSNLELVCKACHWELHPEKHIKGQKAHGKQPKKEVTEERW